ncbi:MAG: glycine cleavage system protein GcvH [Microcystaceae cyanobacterium]
MELEYPEDLRYLDSHEYVRLDGEIATVGITAFALEELGDLVFLELPEINATVEAGVVFGNVESVKAASDLYSPISGTVIEINDAMVESPEEIADDPYGDGWLLKVRVDDPDEALADTLMPEDYRNLVNGED